MLVVVFSFILAINPLFYFSRATGNMRESDAVKTLQNEKDALIGEKHKLKDELNTIRKQLKDESAKWSSEREDLQNIIGEKTRLFFVCLWLFLFLIH